MADRRPVHRVVAAAALLAALAPACTLVRPLDGLTCEPGAGNASCLYGQPCDADADCATASCAARLCQCPAGMVTIESSFCIDETEVSNAAYRRFLATSPDLEAQEPFCLFNGSFDFDTGPDAPDVCNQRLTGDELPATCLDWCDARAFCKSLGKRLCGKIHGGALPYGTTSSALGEWFEACSKGGERAHSTGAFDAQQCNGDSAETAPVGDEESAACEGGYHGLQHMSGNVREWEDSCSGSTGPGDTCVTRGGAFDSGNSLDELRCDARDGRERADTDHTIGFRCCSG
ncbi:formylglycine-generating enzyme family protein [Sorangium sp. So ce1097]|uniref:formylglycine-generating enzyme family protein n=1 Tax=Sorangium sp. So ce1097 TaxID=3133330 RepID=UPI003F60F648